jgi:hypothetical protein
VKASNVIILAVALNAPFALWARLFEGQVDTAHLIFFLSNLAFLDFAAWIAWKNVTVLNAVIQHWTLTSLFLLGTFSLITVLLPVIKFQSMAVIVGALGLGYIGLLATVSAITVLWLRHIPADYVVKA